MMTGVPLSIYLLGGDTTYSHAELVTVADGRLVVEHCWKNSGRIPHQAGEDGTEEAEDAWIARALNCEHSVEDRRAAIYAAIFERVAAERRWADCS